MKVSAHIYDFPCTDLAFYAIPNPVLSQILELRSEDHLISTLQLHSFPLLFLIHYVH